MTSKPSSVLPPDNQIFVLEKDQKELDFMEEKLE